MKLRDIAILAVALLVGAIGLWFWSGSGGTDPAPSETSDASSVPAATPPPATSSVPAAAVPSGLPPAVVPGPAVPPGGEQPAGPVRITSSVVPGIPVGRGAPAPMTPPAALPPAAKPGPTPRPEPDGKAEVERVQYMLRDFRTRMGENPVGSNAEIMKAVMGGNPVKARLGPPEGQGLNEQGELVDRWGSPYFFHQMSKDSMEIRSAGPDRKMWTSDDLVAQ